MAHAFNNTLTTIIGYSNLLVSQLAPESPLRPGLAEIRISGEKAAELTRRLMACGANQFLNFKVVDVREGSRRGLVEVDPERIQRAFLDLFLNSREAMPAGGVYTLETDDPEWHEAPRAARLGLASVQGMVRQCGGNIQVYSESDKGTVFRIYLPVAHPGDKPS